ncbi:MAG: S9 family peptidase [Pseudomonadota bacterium]
MTPQNLPATLSIERVFADPGLNGPAPANIKISPDSSRVAFLRGTAENQLRYDLWEFNRKTGNTGLLVSADSIASVDAELSDEEKARRERQRISALSGIVDYHFSPDGQALLFPLGGDLYLYNLVTGNTNALTQSAGAEIDPKFSPKGRYISFVRGHDLYMIEIETGKETRLTDTGSETVRNGLAEFIAQEEMDRDTAYWWAPDETAIAFLQTDESGVAIEKRYEVYAEKINIVEQRYPATGTANATYKLGILDVGSLATQFLDLGDEPDIYIARVDWYPDSLYLTAQRQSRDQRTLDLLRFDRHSGNARTLLTETSDIWIDLYDDLHFLPERKQFVWASARDGFKHFYLYDYEGNLQRQLTAGDWEVTGNRNKQALLSIDKVSGDIFFMATKATPTERHLYRSNLKVQKNRGPQRISDTAGWHNISFANDSSFYVDSFSNGDTPPQVRVHKANGDALGFIEENPLNDQHPYAPYLATHASMEFGTLKANDGQDLHYYIKRPKEASSEKRPAIVFVYGGPHGQRVKNQWGGLIEQAFVQRGYVVFSLDNRGTDFRGTDFDAPIYQRLGQDEVLDQQVGAKYLASLPDVDPKRIGIYGWSYGGYMTLMCMLKTPDTYAAGVAGAPVTDWHLYDTHYTERYLGHPEQNPEGYEAGSVFPFVKNLNAPLLLMHGMADDNVLFSHTTKLMQTLQSEGKLFELMTYPGSKHSLIRGPREGTHAFRSILDFFDRHLGQKN